MRKVYLLLVLLAVPASLFAQPWRDGRGRRYDRYYDNRFELTPFLGYTWGGTIYSDVTDVFGEDVESASSANYGLNFGIPLGDTSMKLDLMVNRQDTDLRATGGGIFEPNNRVANFHVTYYHAGLEIPFDRSPNATPYFVVSAGVANLDPDINGVSPSNRFSGSVGLGVKMPINPQFGVRLEGRGYFTSLGDSTDNCYHCYDTTSRTFAQGQVNLGFFLSF